jgi:hypothetical protein
MEPAPAQPTPPPIPPPAAVAYYSQGGSPPPGYGWPPPSPYDLAASQAAQDDSHLRTLSICHYVMAGLTFLISFVFFIHIWMGVMMETGGFGPTKGNQAPPPPGFGYLFIVLGSVAVLYHWAQAICACISARNIARRRGRTFTLVTAGILCLQMPLGTVLGVFTFIVLARESVKARYANRS